MACNPIVIKSPGIRHVPNVADADILEPDQEIDFNTEDTYPEKYLEILTGRTYRHETNYKKSDRDETTNFLMYMIGHGGNGYFKLQDTTVIFAKEMKLYLEDPSNKSK